MVNVGLPEIAGRMTALPPLHSLLRNRDEAGDGLFGVTAPSGQIVFRLTRLGQGPCFAPSRRKGVHGRIRESVLTPLAHGYKLISVHIPPAHGNDVAAFAVGDVLGDTLSRPGIGCAPEQVRSRPDGRDGPGPIGREAPGGYINAAACDIVCVGVDPSVYERSARAYGRPVTGPTAPQQIVSPVLIARNTVRVHSSPSHRAKALSTRCKLRSSRCPMSGPTLSW